MARPSQLAAYANVEMRLAPLLARMDATGLAVDAAVRRHMNPCTVLELCFGYDWYGKISYLLPRYNAQTLESDFGAQVRLRLMMTSDKVPAFQKEITELTAASVLPQTVKEICADLE